MRAISLSTPIGSGLVAGMLGGTTIWVYELIVWVHFLHLRTISGLFENSAVLAFGPRVLNLGAPWPLLLSAAVHYITAVAWAIGFALLWPVLRARNVEATLAALFCGVHVPTPTVIASRRVGL